MIAVTGEALVDLVVDGDSPVVAQPGGGPFNTARTIGRLGQKPAFLGRLSQDGFGRLLRTRLDQDGVSLGVPELTDAPTTLAAVDVDPAGAARYRFYLAGTSAADLDYPLLAAARPADLAVLHAGTLALVMEPIATSIERLITADLPPDALVMVDPNCRPQVITDQRAYRARLSRILSRTDVVKVSVEDMAYLFPATPVPAAAAALLGQGPALVLVTDGPRRARAYLSGQELIVDVPQVHVVDTIGAGDAFGGAFLAWWSASKLTRSDLSRSDRVRAALEAAVEVAALTCTRVGADPPWLAEVRDRPGWSADPLARPAQPLA
jgi:fructokinase